MSMAGFQYSFIYNNRQWVAFGPQTIISFLMIKSTDKIMLSTTHDTLLKSLYFIYFFCQMKSNLLTFHSKHCKILGPSLCFQPHFSPLLLNHKFEFEFESSWGLRHSLNISPCSSSMLTLFPSDGTFP